MGVARGEVQPWHRAGLGAAPPERSHAISSLFLPPEASQALGRRCRADKRRLAGVRLMETAHPGGGGAGDRAAGARGARGAREARRAGHARPRAGARGWSQHLRRWNIEADDTAGRPLPQTAAGPAAAAAGRSRRRAGRAGAADRAARASAGAARATGARRLARRRRARSSWRCAGRARRPGSSRCAPIAAKARVGDWWREVEAMLAPLLGDERSRRWPTGSTRSPPRARRCAARRCGRARTAARWPRSSRNCALHAREVGTRARRRASCPPCCARRWTASRCARPRAAIRASRSTACSKRA